MMLHLPKARFDIVVVNDDVIIWVRQSEVPNPCKDFQKGIPKDTVKFNAFVH